MNRPGRAAKAAPRVASPSLRGSSQTPPCCKHGSSSAGQVGGPMGDARTWGRQPPGSRSLAFREDEEREKA